MCCGDSPTHLDKGLRGETLVVNSQQIQRHGRESDFDLLVHWLPEYREKLLATAQELRLYVQDELQIVIQLDNWHHLDAYGWNQIVDRSIVPSDTKSMQMIAQVLVTGNLALERGINLIREVLTGWGVRS